MKGCAEAKGSFFWCLISNRPSVQLVWNIAEECQGSTKALVECWRVQELMQEKAPTAKATVLPQTGRDDPRDTGDKSR